MGRALLIVIAIGLAAGAFVPMADRAAPADETPSGGNPPRPAPSDQVETGGRWGEGQEQGIRLERAANGHFLAQARVNGAPVAFVVDTGATTVALTVEDARRAGIAVNPARFTIVGTGAGGPLRGQQVAIDRVDLEGREVRGVNGVVIEGLEVSLLGQSYLSRLESVTMNGATMVLR
jgi:aspartyl protease family protein